MNALNMVFFVIYGKFWPFGEEKKRGGYDSYKRFLFAIFREKKRKKIPYFRPFLLRCLKIYIAQKNFYFSFLCSQNLAKSSSCGRLRGDLPHKIEGKTKKRNPG